MNRNGLRMLAILEGVSIVLLGWSLWCGRSEDLADPSPAQAAAKPGSVVPEPVDARSQADPSIADRESTPPSQIRGESTSPSLAVLFGRILTSDASALAQGAVSITRDDMPGTLSVRIGFDRSSPEFALPELEPGRYTLTAGASGCRNLTETIEIAAGVDHLRHDMVLKRTWDLRVLIVTPRGEPLPGVFAAWKSERGDLTSAEISAIATTTPPPSPIPDVSLRLPDFGIGHWNGGTERIMDGRRISPKRYAGVLELPVDVPLYVSATLRSAVLATERVEPGQKEVRLVVPLSQVTGSLCTVRVRVIDEVDGKPAAGVRVSLDDGQSAYIGNPMDAEGRGELLSRPGRLQLAVYAKDRMAPPWDLDLTPGANVELTEVVLRTPVKVRLQCEGAPADKKPSVRIRCLDPLPLSFLRDSWRSSWMPDGASSVEVSVYPGRYAARATAGSRMANMEFDTASLGDRPVMLRFAEAAVLHVIPPPLDRPVGLALTDGSGASVWNRQISWEGAFDIVVQPGTYTAAIRRPDGTTEPRTLTLPVGSKELDLR